MTSKDLIRDMKSFLRADMLNAAGELERPLQSYQYAPPEIIKLHGHIIIWKEKDFGQINLFREKRRPNPNLLFKFIKLRKASPQQIFDFARKWGVLGICKHGLPYTHIPQPTLETDFKYWCEPLETKEGYFWEPIQSWREYASWTYAILKIAVNLHQGKLGDVNDWKVIYGRHPKSPPNLNPLTLDKSLLSALINHWVEISNLRPRFDWSEKGIFVSFDSNLFGVIASQLLMVISRTQGLGICSNCSQPFIPLNRRPKANQRNYCQQCGKRAAWRDAKADQRQRQRS
jgi:hypothetical protein